MDVDLEKNKILFKWLKSFVSINGCLDVQNKNHCVIYNIKWLYLEKNRLFVLLHHWSSYSTLSTKW